MLKGQNSVDNVGGIKVPCIFSYNALYLYKFHENAFKSYIVDTISIQKYKEV